MHAWCGDAGARWSTRDNASLHNFNKKTNEWVGYNLVVHVFLWWYHTVMCEEIRGKDEECRGEGEN
jgi:hypothetical protein